MKTQQTKASWTPKEQGEANQYFILSEENGKWLASITMNGEQTTEEQKANLKLMAAAPELLDALQKLVKIVNPQNQSMYRLALRWMEQAEDAIKKATE